MLTREAELFELWISFLTWTHLFFTVNPYTTYIRSTLWNQGFVLIDCMTKQRHCIWVSTVIIKQPTWKDLSACLPCLTPHSTECLHESIMVNIVYFWRLQMSAYQKTAMGLMLFMVILGVWLPRSWVCYLSWSEGHRYPLSWACKLKKSRPIIKYTEIQGLNVILICWHDITFLTLKSFLH